MHGRDHREKPERHLPGGEGRKEGTACFCAGMALGSYPTSQQIKYIAAECERAPLLSMNNCTYRGVLARENHDFRGNHKTRALIFQNSFLK